MTTTAKATSRRVVLTRDAYRSLANLVSKAMVEGASFDPEVSYPKELRKKYDSLYMRLVELFADKPLIKEDRDELAHLSYGVKIREYDFVLGTMTLGFSRTMARVTKNYVLHISSEEENNLTAAKKAHPAEDAEKIARGYSMV